MPPLLLLLSRCLLKVLDEVRDVIIWNTTCRGRVTSATSSSQAPYPLNEVACLLATMIFGPMLSDALENNVRHCAFDTSD